jgi:hypothetical protein
MEQYFIDRKIGKMVNNNFYFSKKELIKLRLTKKMIENHMYDSFLNNKTGDTQKQIKNNWSIKDLKKIIDSYDDPNIVYLQNLFKIKRFPRKQHEMRLLAKIFNYVYEKLKKKGIYQYRINFSNNNYVVPDGVFLNKIGNPYIAIEIQEKQHSLPYQKHKDIIKTEKLESVFDAHIYQISWDIDKENDDELNRICQEIVYILEEDDDDITIERVGKLMNNYNKFCEQLSNKFGRELIDNDDDTISNEFLFDYDLIKSAINLDNTFDSYFNITDYDEIDSEVDSESDSDDSESSSEVEMEDIKDIENINEKWQKTTFKQNIDYIKIDNKILLKKNTMIKIVIKTETEIADQMTNYLLEFTEAIAKLHKICKKNGDKRRKYINENRVKRAQVNAITHQKLRINELEYENRKLRIINNRFLYRQNEDLVNDFSSLNIKDTDLIDT